MRSSVVTRFAPSPTGFLHIGGARTALFNWLYAKHTGGKMLLRIEDTDRERSTEAAVEAIIKGLHWLGLEWDGEPISQFARAARHREVAEELVRRGKAYRAYETAEELAAMRDKAKAEGRFVRYDGAWRDRDPAEAPPGVAPVIRIRAPQDGETVIHDHVQGRVAFPNKDLDDFIILRSDGTPTYMHAVVVDDHDMGVTHVIRGDDHLTNAGRQTIIYEAMGWPVPEWAHIPLIHGPDGAKLSKRHGALGIEAYRAMGYLPEALRNYLCAPRLVAWRRRDLLQRAGGRVVRSRRHQQGTGADSTSTSSEASTPTTCARRRMPSCSRASRRSCRRSKAGPISPRRLDEAARARIIGIDAGVQGTRQDAGGAFPDRALPGRSATDRSRREGRRAARRGSACAAQPAD